MNNTEKRRQAVSYTRLATPGDLQEDSLEFQKAECQKYAEEMNLDIVEHFGGYEKGRAEERPEFNRMLDYIHEHENISYVLVYGLDRLTRSMWEMQFIIKHLQEHNIHILIASKEPMKEDMISLLFNNSNSND